eukprot:CAMPEP_0117849270 /NCGR_PEP_ID=MMETSP0949-20121206/20998_1 /TAXON_ID=44440 /ORGANISM="Chattonella subsalsa, Strain CCMP2191" /LENGTH=410 /DNA_ID=CAMNT_0005696453 /DNA_START=65 /DNA_END=1298 /DNA_ORIENTATION=+
MGSCPSSLLPSTTPTPLFSSIGGLLLAISTSIILLAFNGKLLGLSGMFEGLLFKDSHFQWKAAFVASFMAMAQLLKAASPQFLDQSGLGSSWGVFCLGGFLVGFGTRLGNGCTSGHGICGLARLSSRSICAVLVFMTAAIATASSLASVAVIIILGCAAFYKNLKNAYKVLCTMVSASLFSAGLILAGMGRRIKILNFLVFSAGWDYSLLFILGVAVVVCFFAFRVILHHLDAPILCELRAQLEHNDVMVDEERVVHIRAENEPATVLAGVPPNEEGGGVVDESSVSSRSSSGRKLVLKRVKQAAMARGVDLGSFDGCTFGIPTNNMIDLKLVLGSWCFGVGWGLTGLCPGPSMLLAAAGYPRVALAFIPMMGVGMSAARAVKRNLEQFAKTLDVDCCTDNLCENCVRSK